MISPLQMLLLVTPITATSYPVTGVIATSFSGVLLASVPFLSSLSTRYKDNFIQVSVMLLTMFYFTFTQVVTTAPDELQGYYRDNHSQMMQEIPPLRSADRLISNAKSLDLDSLLLSDSVGIVSLSNSAEKVYFHSLKNAPSFNAELTYISLNRYLLNYEVDAHNLNYSKEPLLDYLNLNAREFPKERVLMPFSEPDMPTLILGMKRAMERNGFPVDGTDAFYDVEELLVSLPEFINKYKGERVHVKAVTLPSEISKGVANILLKNGVDVHLSGNKLLDKNPIIDELNVDPYHFPLYNYFPLFSGRDVTWSGSDFPSVLGANYTLVTLMETDVYENDPKSLHFSKVAKSVNVPLSSVKDGLMISDIENLVGHFDKSESYIFLSYNKSEEFYSKYIGSILSQHGFHFAGYLNTPQMFTEDFDKPLVNLVKIKQSTLGALDSLKLSGWQFISGLMSVVIFSGFVFNATRSRVRKWLSAGTLLVALYLTYDIERYMNIDSVLQTFGMSEVLVLLLISLMFLPMAGLVSVAFLSLYYPSYMIITMLSLMLSMVVGETVKGRVIKL